MAQRQPAGRAPQLNLIAILAAIAGALAVGFFGSRYLGLAPPAAAPQSKLQHAVEAFRMGYDQAALAVLQPLADEGNPKAQYWLADIEENGLGVKPDVNAALALLQKSAKQGFVPAERRLGELYLRGDKTLQDFGQARMWLNQAAVAGDAEAQRELGSIYALGLGVDRDPAEAYGWYENAVLHGNGLAKEMRDEVLTHMSPTDITKGEEIAKAIAAEIKPAKTKT